MFFCIRLIFVRFYSRILFLNALVLFIVVLEVSNFQYVGICCYTKTDKIYNQVAAKCIHNILCLVELSRAELYITEAHVQLDSQFHGNYMIKMTQRYSFENKQTFLRSSGVSITRYTN